jgi:hypothetical protein
MVVKEEYASARGFYAHGVGVKYTFMEGVIYAFI